MKRLIDPWRLRLLAGGALILLTPVLSLRPPSSPWIAGATLLILGHVLIGVWVFVCRLRALSTLHQHLDIFAGVLMGGAVLSTSRPATWCAFFAGAFAVAILKYRVCLDEGLSEGHKAYVLEKIRLETPAVLMFALAAAVQARGVIGGSALRILEIALFAGALLFAVYLIFIRRIYPPRG